MDSDREARETLRSDRSPLEQCSLAASTRDMGKGNGKARRVCG